jgi:hypothetical protein
MVRAKPVGGREEVLFGKVLTVMASRLHELITSVIHEQPSPARVGEFVELCRSIALVQLRRKAASGKLRTDFFRMSLDDLAIDAVADLLEQDDDGSLLQIAAYARSVSYQSLTEAEAMSHMRRLVYAKVNQSLFRMYNEFDPSLGKVLRNMKLAFQSAHSLVIVDRLGEQFIAPSMCETLEHLPVIDPETLEAHVREFFSENPKMPHLLGRLAAYLREQTAHSRFVPIMTVAYALRQIYTGDNDPAPDEGGIEEQLYVEDLDRIIGESCRKVRKEYHPRYVGKKSVTEETFVNYFQVVEAHLRLKLIGGDGAGFSFYENLRTRQPGLSLEDYRKDHRAKLEYLAQLCLQEARDQCKRHL